MMLPTRFVSRRSVDMLQRAKLLAMLLGMLLVKTALANGNMWVFEDPVDGQKTVFNFSDGYVESGDTIKRPLTLGCDTGATEKRYRFCLHLPGGKLFLPSSVGLGDDWIVDGVKYSFVSERNFAVLGCEVDAIVIDAFFPIQHDKSLKVKRYILSEKYGLLVLVGHRDEVPYVKNHFSQDYVMLRRDKLPCEAK